MWVAGHWSQIETKLVEKKAEEEAAKRAAESLHGPEAKLARKAGVQSLCVSDLYESNGAENYRNSYAKSPDVSKSYEFLLFGDRWPGGPQR